MHRWWVPLSRIRFSSFVRFVDYSPPLLTPFLQSLPIAAYDSLTPFNPHGGEDWLVGWLMKMKITKMNLPAHAADGRLEECRKEEKRVILS
jgi:hypothetical protein